MMVLGPFIQNKLVALWICSDYGTFGRINVQS